MAAPLLLAMAGGGAVLKAYGKYKSAQQQAEAKRSQALLDIMQGQEILARNEINNDLLSREATRFSGKQAAQMAASGGAFSATSASILEETALLAGEEIARNTREARFESHMKNLEAESAMRSADQIETAGKIGAFGSLLSSGASIAGSSPGG